MMNKKLIALFVVILAIATTANNCLADGFFSNLGSATGGLVKDTGTTVANVPTRLTTGESIEERRQNREMNQENRGTRRGQRRRARQQNRQNEYYTGVVTPDDVE